MLMPSDVGDTVAAAKRALRGNAKFLRGRIGAEERLHAAESLARHAATVPLFAVPVENGVVGVYFPIGGEIDVRPLVAWLRRLGWRIALPVVEKADAPLTFREWREDAPLVVGAFGTQQPGEDAPVCRPGVLLLPLLAFDAAGFRLGYGGGYYDRTLAEMEETGPRVAAVGVAFAIQEIEMVPHESWDRRLDMVLTERGALLVHEGHRHPRRRNGYS